MVLYEIKIQKNISIIKHMRLWRVLLTFAYLECIFCDTQSLRLESRTHGVELPEDFRGSFLAQRRVCEHGDVGAFR